MQYGRSRNSEGEKGTCSVGENGNCGVRGIESGGMGNCIVAGECCSGEGKNSLEKERNKRTCMQDGKTKNTKSGG